MNAIKKGISIFIKKSEEKKQRGTKEEGKRGKEEKNREEEEGRRREQEGRVKEEIKIKVEKKRKRKEEEEKRIKEEEERRREEEKTRKQEEKRRDEESRYENTKKCDDQILKHISTQYRARKILNNSFQQNEENEEDLERILAFMSELTDYKFDFLAEKKIYLSAKQPEIDEKRKIIFSKFNPTFFPHSFHLSPHPSIHLASSNSTSHPPFCKKDAGKETRIKKTEEEEKEGKNKKMEEKRREEEREEEWEEGEREEKGEEGRRSEQKEEKPPVSLLTVSYLEEGFRRLRKDCREEVKESKEIRREFGRNGKKIKRSLEKLDREAKKFYEMEGFNKNAIILKKLLKYVWELFLHLLLSKK